MAVAAAGASAYALQEYALVSYVSSLQSGDRGTAVHDWVQKQTGSNVLGHIAGIGTVLGDSVVGTAATIASLPKMGARAAWNGLKSLF
jgi:hypothetical protein